MKKDIHPKYELAIIRCACGNEVEVRTTAPGINVEICSACHPFFTGKQKFVDSAGRVEKFRRRYGLADEASTADAVERGRAEKRAKKPAPPSKKKVTTLIAAGRGPKPPKRPKPAAGDEGEISAAS